MTPIALNILRLRNSLGLTQSEFAEKAKLSVRGLQDIEYGYIKEPAHSTLKKIAAAFGVKIDTITGESANIKAEQSPKKLELIGKIVLMLDSKSEEDLQKIIDNVSDSDKKDVASLKEKFTLEGYKALLNCRRVDAQAALALIQAPIDASALLKYQRKTAVAKLGVSQGQTALDKKGKR
jgi:transcriptional regulator with XRE-family HTH domain